MTVSGLGNGRGGRAVCAWAGVMGRDPGILRGMPDGKISYRIARVGVMPQDPPVITACGRIARAVTVASMLALVSVAAAACSANTGNTGGKLTAPTSTPATTSHSHSSGSGNTTTTSSTTTTPTTTTGRAVPARCTASQVTAAFTQLGASAGTVYASFTLTNSSGSTCSLNGYAALEFYDASGSLLATELVHNGTSAVTRFMPVPVTLEPSASASFNVAYSDVSASQGSCSASSYVAIALPGGTFHYPTLLTLSESLAPCSGRLNVSALYAGPSQH